MTEKQKLCTHNPIPVSSYIFDFKKVAVILYVVCSICKLEAKEVFTYSHTEDMDGVKLEQEEGGRSDQPGATKKR